MRLQSHAIMQMWNSETALSGCRNNSALSNSAFPHFHNCTIPHVDFGPHQELPNGANTNAYCWVDVVVSNANALVTFTGDGPSALPDPRFIARAGEPNRVMLLIGKMYTVTCNMPIYEGYSLTMFSGVCGCEPGGDGEISESGEWLTLNIPLKWGISGGPCVYDAGHVLQATSVQTNGNVTISKFGITRGREPYGLYEGN